MFLFWRLLDTLALWLDSRGLLYSKQELDQLKREAERKDPTSKDKDKDRLIR